MAVTLLLSAGCATRLVDRFDDTAGMRTAVLELVPVGTPMEDARRRLELEGFRCELPATHRFEGVQDPLHYAHCDGRSRGLLVYRRWQLALVDSAGRLSDVLVATGLVGL